MGMAPLHRILRAHAANNDAATCKRFADGQIAPESAVTTDGHAGYNAASLGARPHEGIVQTKAERASNDVVQICHWSNSNLKRWLLGTHAGAVSDKHLQTYLDEFAFRFNRRKTKGVARIAACVIATLVTHAALPMRSLIKQTCRRRWFSQPALSG